MPVTTGYTRRKTPQPMSGGTAFPAKVADFKMKGKIVDGAVHSMFSHSKHFQQKGRADLPTPVLSH